MIYRLVSINNGVGLSISGCHGFTIRIQYKWYRHPHRYKLVIVSQCINTIDRDNGPVPVPLPVSTLMSTLSTISYYRYKSGIVFEYHFPGYSSTRVPLCQEPAAQRTLATRSRRDRARAPVRHAGKGRSSRGRPAGRARHSSACHGCVARFAFCPPLRSPGWAAAACAPPQDSVRPAREGACCSDVTQTSRAPLLTMCFDTCCCRSTCHGYRKPFRRCRVAMGQQGRPEHWENVRAPRAPTVQNRM